MRDIFNKIKKKIAKLPSKIYIGILLVVGVWVIFFDNHSLMNMIELKGDIKKLEKERDYYKEKIDKDNQKILELKTNKKNLEKFAREQYLMKKKNEDIYIIINKEEEEKKCREY